MLVTGAWLPFVYLIVSLGLHLTVGHCSANDACVTATTSYARVCSPFLIALGRISWFLIGFMFLSSFVVFHWPSRRRPASIVMAFSVCDCDFCLAAFFVAPWLRMSTVASLNLSPVKFGVCV